MSRPADGVRLPRLGGMLSLARVGCELVRAAASPANPAPARSRPPCRIIPTSSTSTPTKSSTTRTRTSSPPTGNVVLYYKGRILQADQVVYDRNNKRMQALGRAKFTDERGNITYAPKFDLTDDFASGFADGVQALTTDRTRFSSPHIERSGGDITTMDYTTYTACEPCKAHPEWPPEWQIRAGKVIEDQETHTIYFENAWIDVFGVPIGYLPYMSMPDPTVTRKSGVLPPSYTASTNLGSGIAIPYFLALAPNYDVTITPYYYTRQGAALDLEWRHRIENGEYKIVLTGVDQTGPGGFRGHARRPPVPRLRADRRHIYLNRDWTFGWDVTGLTDKDLHQRLQAVEHRAERLLPAGSGFAGLSARTGRSRLLRPLRLLFLRPLRAISTSARIRSPRRCSTTSARSRSTRRPPTASAARWR